MSRSLVRSSSENYAEVCSIPPPGSTPQLPSPTLTARSGRHDTPLQHETRILCKQSQLLRELLFWHRLPSYSERLGQTVAEYGNVFIFLQRSAMQTDAKYLLHLNWRALNLLYLTLKHIGFKVALDKTGTSPPPILHIWAHLPSVWEVVRCPLTWVMFPRKYQQFKAKIFVGIFQEY